MLLTGVCVARSSSVVMISMPHSEVFPRVLSTGEPLTTHVTRVRLRVGVCASVNVETAALCELFTTRVTRERLVAGVSSLV